MNPADAAAASRLRLQSDLAKIEERLMESLLVLAGDHGAETALEEAKTQWGQPAQDGLYDALLNAGWSHDDAGDWQDPAAETTSWSTQLRAAQRDRLRGDSVFTRVAA